MNYLESLSLAAPFIPNGQLITIQLLARPDKEEYKVYENHVKELAKTINNMPKVYEQDGKGDEAIVYLHYFTASYDWYITEKDTEWNQNQAFGWADMGHGELGYISIAEIKKSGAEIDLHWTPKTLGEVKNKTAPKPEEKKEKENLPDILDLNDWLYNNHKEYFGATKYLSNPYDTWVTYWRDQGSPDISGEGVEIPVPEEKEEDIYSLDLDEEIYD